MTDTRYLLELAESAALEAGQAIMKVYRSGEFSAMIKPDKSPVTKADRNSQAILLERLGKTNLPIISEEGADIEFGKRKFWEYYWLIDPLDGTKEFISGNGEFTVNIALVRRDMPAGGVIYLPCTDAMYTGSKETGVYKREKGKLTVFPPRAERNRLENLLERRRITVAVSRSHLSADTKIFVSRFQHATLRPAGSSMKFMMLLENRADIYPRMGTTMEWDTAAGHAILNASNRGVYQQDMGSELRYNKPDLRNPYFIAM
ncbi:MAG TPA: 3'(2'),5'-bisphosphate nucleotidase CysQ [Puia sp.]|uniref:3'(2'),5'-bisphosphate nucleotidase CysQ n=1 Tax=Puia sp. TaxID=2045100 RepID=UPI002CF02924|nr:3'(2'),5'-bisphosphate nucleotidase CysQ [Puia sp.]HVU94151.1 3'(2'),5'-bisphosphate nucleotidase CysQ [Puia sp.]